MVVSVVRMVGVVKKFYFFHKYDYISGALKRSLEELRLGGRYV